jgi:hypothetical protein
MVASRSSSGLDLTSHLLDLDDHKLGGLERREADQDIHGAEVDVILGRRFFVALDEVGLTGRSTLEGSLDKEIVHERGDVEPDLRPEGSSLGSEDDPPGAAQVTSVTVGPWKRMP